MMLRTIQAGGIPANMRHWQEREREQQLREATDQPGRRLLEHVGAGNPRVDRANGIIRGVRILGPNSRNGRTYTEACIRGAIGLYEGSRVCVDHPERNHSGSRSVDDLLGTLRGVRFQEGGLNADLHLFPSHRVAGIVMDAAEKAPETLGFSHNAEGREVQQGGRRVVESLDKVYSVDLVLNPATTKGLFESDAGESYPANHATFLESLRSHAGPPARRLRETDGMAEDPKTRDADQVERDLESAEAKELLAIDPNTSTEQELREAFLLAALGILKDADTVASKIARLKKLLDSEASAVEQMLRAIDPGRVARLAVARKEAAEATRQADRTASRDAERREALEGYVSEVGQLIESHGVVFAQAALERELHHARRPDEFARALSSSAPSFRLS